MPFGMSVGSSEPLDGRNPRQLPSPPTEMHSKLTAVQYALQQFGHPESSPLRSHRDRTRVLHQPSSLVVPMSRPRPDQPSQIHAATGVLPALRSLAAFPPSIQEHLVTEERLVAFRHQKLTSRLQRQANSWQLNVKSTFHQFPHALGPLQHCRLRNMKGSPGNRDQSESVFPSKRDPEFIARGKAASFSRQFPKKNP